MQFLLKILDQNRQLRLLILMVILAICFSIVVFISSRSNMREQAPEVFEANNVVLFESNELTPLAQILPIETPTYSMRIEQGKLYIRYFGSEDDYIFDRQVISLLLKEFNMTFYNPLIIEERESQSKNS